MGTLTYTSLEESTPEVIVTEETKAVEETPATPVAEVEHTTEEE